MKAWLKTIFSRLGDLVVKLIAVKYLVCVVLTVLYIVSTEKTQAMFLTVAGLWALASGLRAYEKRLEVKYGPTRAQMKAFQREEGDGK